MPKAIVVHQSGGPEELRFEYVPDPAPGPGEARVRHTAIGVNFIDVYFRRGIYKTPQFPFVPGQEGAGIVEAIGPGVSDVAVGDRVVYASLQGAYAEVRLAPASIVDVDGESTSEASAPGCTAIGDWVPDSAPEVAVTPWLPDVRRVTPPVKTCVPASVPVNT